MALHAGRARKSVLHASRRHSCQCGNGLNYIGKAALVCCGSAADNADTYTQNAAVLKGR